MGFFDRFKKDKSKVKTKVKAGAPEQPKGKVALCLSGGGARGFAHIGVFRAFEEHGIEFDFCMGVSAGSLLGALYSSGMTSKEMESYGAKLQMKDVRSGFILNPQPAENIGKIVTNILGDAKIEDLKKKFYCLAVDLVEGKQVIIEEGSVGEAVSASSCVPILFKPVVKGKQHLVDGGLLNNIPADVCRMLGADKVITVDINPTRGGGTSELGLLSVLKATFNIMSANSSWQGYMHSDVIIAPNLAKFKASDKEGYEEMIELGYKAALEKIEDVKKIVGM